MNDRAVLRAIEQMEAWVVDPKWEPDPDALSQWNSRYSAAVALAERGDEWPGMVSRAHALGQLLAARVEGFGHQRDAIRAELMGMERGRRALGGYGSGLA